MTGRVKRQADLLIRLLHKKFTNEPAEIEDQLRTHQRPVAVCINRARLLSRITPRTITEVVFLFL